MKIDKYRIFRFLLVIGFMLLIYDSQTIINSSSAAQKTQVGKDGETAVVTKKNVVIQKRIYRYIEYEKIRPGVIRLKYIVPQEELLVIPSKIDGCKVEEVGKDTESGTEDQCVNITKGKKVKKVIISKGIQTIRKHAFFEMNVTEAVLPKSLKNIEGFAFSGCMLQKINLDSVEKIGYGAFLGCENLKKIRLQNEKVVVEASAFSACSRLEEIEFPKRIKGSLGDGCFEKTGIKKIQWPRFAENVEKGFGTHVFQDCSKLEKVEFPNGMLIQRYMEINTVPRMGNGSMILSRSIT